MSSEDFNFDIEDWGNEKEDIKKEDKTKEEITQEKADKKRKGDKKKKEKKERENKIELQLKKLLEKVDKQQEVLDSLSIDPKSISIPLKINEVNEIVNMLGRNVNRLESRHGNEMKRYPKSSTTADIKLIRKFYKNFVEDLVEKGYDVVYSDTSSVVVSK